MTTDEPPVASDWLAYHVFYASDSNPILVEAVRPLVRQLREEGLVDRWFFIKYWLEGPHVRVRLRPSTPAARDEVHRRTAEALDAFLARRPALYETDADVVGELYKDMFLAEYSQEQWDEAYGRDGTMPMRPNNSWARYDYEPEYHRYGGADGIALAEWHFMHSSDTVTTLLARSNPHVRPILLGLATQMSLMLAYAFLQEDDAVVDFFTGYRSFWENSYGQRSDDYHESFDRSVVSSGAAIRDRMARIRAAVHGGTAVLGPFEDGWLRHCSELRERVLAAGREGRLSFPARDGSGQRRVLTDPAAFLPVLLSSYVHMTNNRLGVAILDEIYLSYLICGSVQGVQEEVPEEVPA